MKDKTKLILYILLFLSAFFPILTLVLFCLEYSVSLFNYIFSAISSALIFVILTTVILKAKEVVTGKALKFLIVLLPLISLVNAVVYVFKSKSAVVAVCMAICFVCSAVIAEKICKSGKAKLFSVISSGLLSVPLLIFSVLLLIFGSFGVNTVIDSIPSPDGAYYAEIVDSDHGALGSDTVVYIHKNSKLDLFIMTISKTPQPVYVGEWREYETMQIQWKNENCLIINSEEFPVEI